ncbi:hypothetical protein [Algoriphagus aquimarinus]|uniref:hypothetical protein n=1 Tax=Algoriphagus aquimarinus TaxID=237018 RepID=UPI0030D9B17F|tara:strand:- start:2669 stop:2884 length:216 start_codon:yes stop_codon:yes gene_type:complete
METSEKNLKSLDQFIDENVGAKGTEKRKTFESEYDAFKLGILIQQAREFEKSNVPIVAPKNSKQTFSKIYT